MVRDLTIVWWPCFAGPAGEAYSCIKGCPREGEDGRGRREGWNRGGMRWGRWKKEKGGVGKGWMRERMEETKGGVGKGGSGKECGKGCGRERQGKGKVGRDCAVLKISLKRPGSGPSLTLRQIEAPDIIAYLNTNCADKRRVLAWCCVCVCVF